MIAALFLAAGIQSGANVHDHAFERGSAWAKSPISQQCLNEVAGTNRGRQALIKAQTLAGIIDQIVEGADRLHQSAAQEGRALDTALAAGTISPDQHQAQYRVNSVKIEAGIRAVAQLMSDYPSCGFFRLYPSSPVVLSASAMLRAEQ